ncbi:alpha/beta hydrolase [Neobacillus sp. CF12]|uniref:lipase/acyltransferase domain-containing protein n=1 Tax=Neobacillus sp. CF12 TaxID=3055864 RepID=UPI0025A168F9|nr:alpha/beta hydrolase [Neobacillus sp. CF12]MDM5326820.1 alpha/beta hydrolase [Neobacillus sp. CF12]
MKRIVFIPGIMGSELHEGKKLYFFGGTKRWFSFDNKAVKRLKLEADKKRDIIPGEPLRYGVKLVNNRLQDNVIYAPMLDMLETLSSSTVQVHPYGYDWRQDLWDTCEDFDKLISTFKKEDEIIIVAHSMGGLLAHTYCQWAGEQNKLPNIKQVITLGTPWKGSPDAFKVLKYGIKDKGWFFPNYDTIINIARTFPSIYQLLPSSKYCEHNRYLVEPGRGLKWFDCMEYIQSMEGCNVDSVALLNQVLHQSLQKPWPDSIEHYNVIGVDQGSVGTITLNPNGHDGMQQPVDGDGVVPLDSAIPFDSYNSKGVFYAKASHQGLVYHSPVLEWLKYLLKNGSVTPISDIYITYNKRTNWTMERIDCPVEVLVAGEEFNINKSNEDITRHNIGEATFLIHNSNKPTTIAVEAYDDGRTTIETIRIADNDIKSITKFPSIEANPAKRTIINVEFDNNEPLTKVYIPNENNELNEIKGITVETPNQRVHIPPTTELILNPIGKSINFHYDEKGVNLSFHILENKKSYYLETLYRLNEENWRSYTETTQLTLENGLKLGKNVLEFFSKDVFDNAEKINKQIFYIEPNSPEIYYKFELNPDRGVIIKLDEYYTGVKPYKFYYKINKNEEKVYKKPFEFPAFEDIQLSIKAEDIFESKSNYERLNVDFSNLANVIWDANGFDGTIHDIIELLNESEEDLISSHIGRKETDVDGKIPKGVRSVTLRFKNKEFHIALLPKLEVYLHYHSQILLRSDENVKISFLVYDIDGNPIEDLEPAVKYTLISKNSKKEITDVKVSNDKGVYNFDLTVKDIPQNVQKIKFEFRDTHLRAKPIETRTFKLE